jgi:hypothetical protein
MSSLPFPRRFQSQTQLDLVRHLLGWTAPERAGKIRAGNIPLRDLAVGEFILFNSYAMCGLVPPISSFFLLLLEEFSLQLHHLAPHSILLVAVFAHFMEMFVGVRPCTAIFRHFYALVGTGRSKRKVGAYYFQLRHGMANSYISAFSSSKWEDWREGWVFAEADPHDRLELPTEGPQSDRSTWKAKPTLPEELGPVLDRVKNLSRSGLRSLMVLGDFLKRRIAPLQQRTRMAYMYMGLNDCCRIARGPGSEFSRAELEVAFRAMTGEAFSLEPPGPPKQDQSPMRGLGVAVDGPGVDANPRRGRPGGPAAGRRPQSWDPHSRHLSRPPVTRQPRSEGAKSRRSGPRREGKR